jgi:hypothetical protein
VRLAAPVRAPLVGEQAPLAVTSPQSDHVVYHAWRGREDGTPLLRVVEIRSGRDRILAVGAQTVAWARDGRIAYARGLHAGYRPRLAYVTQVVVRRSRDAPPVQWTRTRAEYSVLAWAGRRLLVSVRACNVAPCHAGDGSPEPDVYALDGPGKLRSLDLGNISAVSPDGRYVVGTFLPTRGQDSPSSIVHVVDVATGRVAASLDLARAARGRVPRAWLLAGADEGAWRGDDIAAVSTIGNGSVLVFLRFVGRRLVLEHVLRLDRTARRGVRYGPFLFGPVFLQGDTRKLLVHVRVITTRGHGVTAALTCDRVTLRCVRGRPLPPRRWFAWVPNPSRPLR